MEIVKLFDDNILEKPDHSKLKIRKTTVLYTFSLVWTVQEQCSLTSLNGRLKDGTWRQIISHPYTDKDGEISINIGNFAVGTEIEIAFGVKAITAIPKLMTLLTNRSSEKIMKLKPDGDEYKSPGVAETWNESVSVTLI